MQLSTAFLTPAVTERNATESKADCPGGIVTALNNLAKLPASAPPIVQAPDGISMSSPLAEGAATLNARNAASPTRTVPKSSTFGARVNCVGGGGSESSVSDATEMPP